MSFEEDNRISSALTIIEKAYPSKIDYRGSDAFELLFRTILSQNTSWKNVEKAVENLKSETEITMRKIALMSRSHLSRLIRPAGLQKIKSKRILDAIEYLMKNYDGDLNGLLDLPLNEARRKLLEIPGVGLKTADVILLFCKARPILPVDTHIARVARRLNVVGGDAGYEGVRASLEAFIKPFKRGSLHLALIKFGRETCKAINPECPRCPVIRYCPSRVNLHPTS